MPLNDPLLAFVPMRFRDWYFPWGFPVRICSNVEGVLDAAKQSWGSCRLRFEATPIEARYLICNGPRRRSPNPVFRAQAHLLTMVADEHNYACGDLERGIGSAWLTEATISNVDFFRYTFLEGLVSCMLETLHLTPIHAACVVKNGHGVLLSAESGMGKSSLAYACARRAWTYVSDDASSLVRGGTGRTVIGDPTLFRFRPSAVDLFPELQGKSPIEPQRAKFRKGKPTIEVRTACLDGIETCDEATIDYVIFLKRDPQMGGMARFASVPREVAVQRLVTNYWPAELSVHQQHSAAVERLLGAALGELTYGDIGPAIDALERVVSRGST